MHKDTCIYIIMYSRLYVYMCTYKQENNKTLKVVRVTPGTLYCCYQFHSGQPRIPMSNSL